MATPTRAPAPGVRANADTPEDARAPARIGAEGIGLCRTEHMFLGERRQLVERLILAETTTQRQEALDALLPLQRATSSRSSRRWTACRSPSGCSTRRCTSSCPTHRAVGRVALAEADRARDDRRPASCCRPCERLHEQNPMLGPARRAARPGHPGPVRPAGAAIAEAAAELAADGGDPRAEIMIPLVGAVQELELVRRGPSVIAEVGGRARRHLDIPIGTMIELPRAALTAGQIAEAAEFFSFGTNDLTQTTWGFSRDDVEAAFFSATSSWASSGSRRSSRSTARASAAWCASP
jgi:pyruvate, orthophosphate dikinase